MSSDYSGLSGFGGLSSEVHKKPGIHQEISSDLQRISYQEFGILLISTRSQVGIWGYDLMEIRHLSTISCCHLTPVENLPSISGCHLVLVGGLVTTDKHLEVKCGHTHKQLDDPHLKNITWSPSRVANLLPQRVTALSPRDVLCFLHTIILCVSGILLPLMVFIYLSWLWTVSLVSGTAIFWRSVRDVLDVLLTSISWEPAGDFYLVSRHNMLVHRKSISSKMEIDGFSSVCCWVLDMGDFRVASICGCHHISNQGRHLQALSWHKLAGLHMGSLRNTRSWLRITWGFALVLIGIKEALE